MTAAAEVRASFSHQTLLEGVDARAWNDIIEQQRTHPQRFSPRNLEELLNGHHYGLPLTLTSVRLALHKSAIATLVLPPFVEKALVPQYLFTEPEGFFQCLPPSLTDLQVPDAQLERPSTLVSWASVKDLDLSYLCRNLVKLCIVYTDCDFSPALFYNLPSTLKEFMSTSKAT